MDTGVRTIYLADVVEGGATHFAPPLMVQRLLQRAPPTRLAGMKQQLQLDSEVDAEAILRWRSQQRMFS
jgi:hypothetical protein